MPVLFTMIVWNQTRNISEACLQGHVVVAKLCTSLCDPVECSTPGSSILHNLLEMFIESVMLSKHLIVCSLFSSCPQSFPESGSFPVGQLFASGGQSIGATASASGSSPALLVSATCWRASLLPPCLLPGLAQAALLALS